MDNKSEIDYRRELNHLIRDISGCYYEQYRERDQDSVARCLHTIKEDEPLEFIEYFDSKFVVAACRHRDEKFVGDDENSCLIRRPRVTSVTIGAELNEDGTVKNDRGAKSFIICARSREQTAFSEKYSWRVPAKYSL